MAENKDNNRKGKNGQKLRFFGIPKLFPYLKNYKKQYIIMVLLGVLSSGVDILLPFFQRYAINTYAGTGVLDTLALFIVLYIGVLLISSLANYVSCYLSNYIEVNVDRLLRERAFNHLQTLSFSYFNQNSVGYIHSRIMSDTSRIGEFVSWSLMDGVWQITYMVGAAAVMLFVNFKLALLILAVVPIVAFLISLLEKKLTELNRKIRDINSKISGDYNEAITGAKTVKSLVVEDKIERDFKKDSFDMKKESVKASRIRALFGSTTIFASSLTLAIVLWRGGIITQSGVMQIGTLSLLMSYAQGIIEPIRWVVDTVSSLISVEVNIERLTKLIATESDVIDRPDVIEKYGTTFEPKKENWEELDGDIEFSDVTFKYPDGEETVLDGFSLKIPKGANIAIVGETGAGKSTLVNLVCRFYEPTEGKILIDGKDARDRSQLWLHSHIGYVLQTPHLFSGTIAENLRYAKPDATDEEINEALKRVSADEVVAKMEKGLDSDVGECGDLLSTGEKQLISFARAVLADPRILILDEATASVDTITEKKIQAAINEITEGRTSIVIAHRLSTIRDADNILVVKNGKIVEQGRHNELMAMKGHYYGLYTRQYEEDATANVLK